MVAVGDGVGAPRGMWEALAEASDSVGGVRLLLGWSFEVPKIDWSAFASVSTLMGGHALRPLIADRTVHYLPVRYGSVPALFAGPLRPDVVIVAARPSSRGLVLGTEVSWLEPAIRSARQVLVEVNPELPDATRAPALPEDRTTVLGEFAEPPLSIPGGRLSPAVTRIGELVAGLIPSGATIQFAPGTVGAAVLAALDEPVAIDTGMITDDVVALDRRGLLRGTPLAAYAVGTKTLYEWADGRPMIAGVETTHDVSRLAGLERFFSVNTALQIDPVGQVNVETVGGDQIGGIGGHADYALGAARCATGASIIALPSTRRGCSTLVARLDAPTTTPRSDIDIVVTECGYADLRGLDDKGRTAALLPLFPAGIGGPASPSA